MNVSIVTLGSYFSSPYGVAVDSSGRILVANTGNSAVKRMESDGSNIVTLGSGFSTPAGVAVDSSGRILVADYGNNAIKRMTILVSDNHAKKSALAMSGH